MKVLIYLIPVFVFIISFIINATLVVRTDRYLWAAFFSLYPMVVSIGLSIQLLRNLTYKELYGRK